MISIIIPCRNRLKNLTNCVKSILKQTYKNFEIIVVDYGGEDDTKKIESMSVDNNLRYIYVDEKGVWNLPRARNVGIRLAKGELIACIDADMILEDNVLEEMYNHFKIHGRAFLYQIQRINMLEHGSTEIMPINTFLGDFQATHRDNFFKIRGFDERLVGYGYEDLDIVIRLNRIGVYQYWIPNVKTFHQWHPMSSGEETYVNMLKSKLNHSYKANYDDWGCPDKKNQRFSEKLWRIFDKTVIFLVIRPIKMIKKFIRWIKRRIK